MTGNADIRVVLVDDLDMVRTGFRLIIDNEDDMVVVGDATNGNEAIEVCRTRHVDVVLMDIRMPELDGLAATRAVLDLPEPPHVIVLTTFGLDEYVTQAISVGCSGFLLKDATADTLVEAIRRVADGDAVMAPSLLRTVFDNARTTLRAQSVHGIDDLTERELDVLKHLATGMSNAEIAEQLYLSEATIKTHITRILSKLGVRDRVQAVIAAFTAGIADPGS